MTSAEINILIRSRAKEARAVFAAVLRDLNKISAAAAQAGNVLDGLTGASAGYVSALGGVSAAAADLAKALALINRSGPAASKNILNIGVAAELSAGTVLQASVAADAFAASLLRLSTAAATAATNLSAYAAAARSAAAAAKAAAKGTAAAADAQAASAASAATSARTAGAELATLAGAQAATARSARGLSRDAYAMGDTIHAQATRLNADGTVWNQFDQGLKAIGQTHQRTGKAFQDTTEEVRKSGDEAGRTGGRFDAAGERLNAFNTKLWDTSDSLRKAGSQMQWTGRQLAVMFTAPTLLAGGLGVAWALEYEKAFTRIKKVYNGDMQELGGIGPEFKGSKFDKFFTAVSNKFGIAREEIADVAADFAQAGLSGAQLAKATKLTAEFSIVGDQDLKKSTEDIISVMAQYKLSSDQMAEAIAHLNAISNETPVSMADLTAGFVRTASVAKEAGVDVRHLGAFIAALTPAAGTATVTANGLKSVFTRLMVPTKEAAGVLEQVGIITDDPNWMSKNAVERLALLSEKFEGLSQQQKFDLAKPFAGLYQINKFVALMDDLADSQGNYAKALAATESPAKSFATYQKELNAFLNSNPQKLKQAGTIIKNSLADAIIPLVPHIVWLAQAIAKVMNGFANMSPEMQKFIVYAALALAAVGPLAMLIGSFAILFGSAGKALSIFGKLLSWTAFNFLGLGKATKQVGDEVVTRTPLIVRAWRGMMAALRGVTTVGAAAINGAWKLGMTLFGLILKVGGALGLKNFAWYQALMVKVSANTQRTIVGQTIAGQRAAAAATAAGGRAQAAGAAAGMAGATKATKAGGRGWIGALIGIVAMFPGTVWKGIKAIPGLFAAMVGQVRAVLSQIGLVFRTVFSGGTVTAVEGTLAKIMVSITSWAARAARAVAGLFPRLGPMLLRSLTAIVPRIGAAGAAIAAGLTGPIGWAIAGIVTLITLFPKQTWNAIKGLAVMLATPFILGARNIVRVLQSVIDAVGQWGSGVREIASKVLDDDGVPILAKPFVIGVRVIAAALRALPGIVVSVFEGVVRVIQRAARAVYEAFSYINPFAHHSPSLVENVTGGMAIVRDEFAVSADSIAASTKRAYDSISAMGQLTAGLRGRVEGMQREETLTKIGETDPSAKAAYLMLERALPGLKSQLASANRAIEQQKSVISGLERQIKAADKAIDGMNDQLDVLRERADAASEALNAAKERLDTFANAPLVGMRAMSDAIFENEMAQKRLRLEIMKMEEAGQTVDDVTDRMAALQGQIETLSGERQALRLGGAGSDILGVYDKMIADLEAQQGATAVDQLSPIAEAQKQLEELQRRGEQLDLENALKFDPLTRQIAQMVDTTKELSFAEITTGIRTNQAAIAQLTVEYDKANSAVAQQEAVIKQAEAARDALNDKLEIEQERLDELTSAQEGLENAIRDVEDAMSDIVGWVDDLNRMLEENEEKAKKAKDAAEDLAAAWENAGLGDFDTGAGLSTLDNAFDDTDIDSLTQQLTDDVAKMFDNIDIGSAIKGFFANIGRWFLSLPGKVVGWIAGIPGAIARQVASWAGDAGSWFAGIGASIGSTVSGWASSAGSWLSGVGSAFGSWASGLWSNHIWPGLVSLPGKLGSFLLSLPGQLVSGLAYLAGFMGAFAARTAAGVGAATVTAMAELRAKLFEVVGNLISELPGLLSRMLAVFANLPSLMWDIATRIWGALWDGAVNVFEQIFRGQPGLINTWLGFFYSIPGRMWNIALDIWGALWDGAVNVFEQIFRGQPGLINTWLGFFYSIPGRMRDIALDIWGGLWDGLVWAVKNTMSWINSKIIEPFVQGVKDGLGIHSPSTVFAEIGGFLIDGLWQGIKNAGSWFKDKVLGWVEDHIPGPIKWALDIHSPSGVTEAIGVNVGEGLAQGIESQAPAVKGAMDKVTSQITSITLPAAPMGDVFAEFAKSTGTAADKLAILKDGLAAFRTESTTAQDVMQAVNDTMRDTPMALEGFNASMIMASGQIDTTTEAGSRMYSQIKDVQAAFDGAAATAFQSAIDQGKSMDEAARAAQDASQRVRDTFVQQAIEAGLPIEAANRLADTYGMIPKDVFTKFNVDLNQADDEVKRFMNEDRTIRINADIIARRLEVNRAAWDSMTAEQQRDSNNASIYSGGGVPKRADGGWIDGPGGPRDDKILALVSNREFIVNARQAARYASILEQINAGTFEVGATLMSMPRFADGGPIGALGRSMATAGSGSGALRDGVAAATTESLEMWRKYVASMETATDALSASQAAEFAGMSATTTAVTAAMSATNQAAYVAMSAAVQTTATAMSSAVVATTTKMTDDMSAKFAAGRDAAVSASATATDTVTTNFQSLATNLASIFNEQIVPIFNAFGPALGTVEGWFGSSVGNIGTIWGGVREPVAAPSRFIVNDVYNNGIRTAWNNVSGWLGLGPLPEAVAAFQSGGAVVDRASLVNPNSPRDIRRGGRLTGSTAGDRTLFAGQGGEFVLSRRMVEQAGGTGRLEAWRRAAMAGRSAEGALSGVPAFANGGAVPGAVLAAEDMLRKHARGQAYVYGGVGPDGFDCSGIASAVWGVLTGQGNPFQRFFTTEANFSQFGFERGLNGLATIGVHNGGGGPFSHMAGTLNGINYESGGAHNSTQYGGPAAGSDHPQFEHAYTLKEIGGVFQSGGLGGGSGLSMLQRVTAEFTKVMDPIRGNIPALAGGIGAVPPTGYQKYYDDVSKYLYGKASEYDAAHPARGNMAYDGSGVEQWRGLVQKVLREKGLPVTLDERVLYQMQTESGGNPNALNDWDINWQNGNPSKGLMQVIQTTFEDFKDPGYDNIWDPESNIRASLNYAIARYGSVENAFRGVGYDSGGWLMPGENQRVYNATGKPEPVLTSEQWAQVGKMAEAVQALSSDALVDSITEAVGGLFGKRPVIDQATAVANAVAASAKEWTPAIYDAAASQTAAADSVAKSASASANAASSFEQTAKQIAGTVNALAQVAAAVATAAQAEEQNFEAWAPVLGAIGGLIEGLPRLDPSYVGADGSALERGLNDVANVGKGLYNVVRDVAPSVLSTVATVGVGIAKLAAENGPLISAALAMLPVNPVGAAIMAAPVLLQGITTLLPTIVQAVTQIVPTLLKGLFALTTKFAPGAQPTYDSMEAAAKAAAAAQTQFRETGSLSGESVQQVSTTKNVQLNIYGDVSLPNIKSGNDAKSFVTNLQALAEG
ncbi:tape measure protein [Rhodococcus phage Reynauld]|uniref:Tape measure protein n=1 Tax=Rhodococcus phage Reynauld TaxID=3062845 RepID=A0ACD4UI77_9CAUD|nr:tape measure protein [Rhodococcus phage Reynauld]